MGEQSVIKDRRANFNKAKPSNLKYLTCLFKEIDEFYFTNETLCIKKLCFFNYKIYKIF